MGFATHLKRHEHSKDLGTTLKRGKRCVNIYKYHDVHYIFKTFCRYNMNNTASYYVSLTHLGGIIILAKQNKNKTGS